jgi:hypothetical protein
MDMADDMDQPYLKLRELNSSHTLGCAGTIYSIAY